MAERIPIGTKVLYGAGAIGPAARQSLFGLYTLYLYTTVMGLPAAQVGLATAVGLAWEAFIGAYIGHVSDRVRSAFGRRHAFMLVGGLLMGAAFWAYMAPPRSLSSGALLAWLLVSTLVVRTGTAAFSVPFLALGAEMADDYHERTSVAWARGFMALVGGAGFTSLSFLVFFPQQSPGMDPKLNYEGYTSMGWVFGLLMVLFALTAILATRSCRSPRGPAVAHAEHDGPGPGLWRGCAVALQHRAFVLIAASCTIFVVAVVLNRIVLLHFLTYQAKILKSTSLSAFEIANFIGSVIGLATGLRLLRRLEKRTLMALASLTVGVTMLSAYLFIGEGRLFGTGNAWAMFLIVLVAGFCASVVLFVPHSMIADIADQDELKTGRRREGLFYGMFAFCQKFATGLSLVAGGILAGKFAGLAPGTAEQSVTTAHRIAMIYGLFPGLLMIFAGILIARYSLNHAQVLDIQARLQDLRAANASVNDTSLNSDI